MNSTSHYGNRHELSLGCPGTEIMFAVGRDFVALGLGNGELKPNLLILHELAHKEAIYDKGDTDVDDYEVVKLDMVGLEKVTLRAGRIHFQRLMMSSYVLCNSPAISHQIKCSGSSLSRRPSALFLPNLLLPSFHKARWSKIAAQSPQHLMRTTIHDTPTSLHPSLRMVTNPQLQSE
jgi:hypothetical protein